MKFSMKYLLVLLAGPVLIGFYLWLYDNMELPTFLVFIWGEVSISHSGKGLLIYQIPDIFCTPCPLVKSCGRLSFRRDYRGDFNYQCMLKQVKIEATVWLDFKSLIRWRDGNQFITLIKRFNLLNIKRS